jgi:hypothetical protein
VGGETKTTSTFNKKRKKERKKERKREREKDGLGETAATLHFDTCTVVSREARKIINRLQCTFLNVSHILLGDEELANARNAKNA